MTRLCAHAQGCTRPVMRMVWSSDAQDPYTMYKRCVCTPPHAGVGSRAEADARRPPTRSHEGAPTLFRRKRKAISHVEGGKRMMTIDISDWAVNSELREAFGKMPPMPNRNPNEQRRLSPVLYEIGHRVTFTTDLCVLTVCFYKAIFSKLITSKTIIYDPENDTWQGGGLRWQLNSSCRWSRPPARTRRKR